MTCAELRADLDRYVQGELPLARAAAFEAHLARCAECESHLMAGLEAPAATATLPREIVPAVDLWPGIEARITERRRGRIALPRWALAAAAGLLVAVSSGVTALVLQSSRVQVSASTGDIQALDAQYAEACDDLQRALNAARSSLAPETLATIEKNLALIDAALTESRRALARDPGNGALGQLVVAVWKQKVDLLRRATSAGVRS